MKWHALAWRRSARSREIRNRLVTAARRGYVRKQSSNWRALYTRNLLARDGVDRPLASDSALGAAQHLHAALGRGGRAGAGASAAAAPPPSRAKTPPSAPDSTRTPPLPLTASASTRRRARRATGPSLSSTSRRRPPPRRRRAARRRRPWRRSTPPPPRPSPPSSPHVLGPLLVGTFLRVCWTRHLVLVVRHDHPPGCAAAAQVQVVDLARQRLRPSSRRTIGTPSRPSSRTARPPAPASTSGCARCRRTSPRTS